ncbi:MAG: tRNA (5-methylaminomethyl-2-thiouridylate)-methyltransferase [Cytophagales bacterium]|jgi:tRNA U34 5-methylaminomethyl-2-thiouridine-forming methyltransferase MnmC|nr:tRNA (5-methylaminomethyl-2-thiouridine)(34)-methyltransferase MnmD [Bacteroidota bacterium]MBS1979673.1 tRNA (5-methylaminomethyl-2-thiouridine)(34)-methyltransferase MnmD [Bacteroidota bacterium]WHZ06926.1 MAG: tRNA (5-methylaminomethyl-2-thiouridylate)-methyltransferase [Cytophagales bacterium]
MNSIKIIETKDGSHSLLNEILNETYHSTHGAIQESRYVFIKNGLEYFLNENKTQSVNIFEVGLGTGLNVLLALEFATKNKIKIKYTSIEAFPVKKEIAGQLNYADLIFFSNGKTLFQEIHASPWEESIQINDFFCLKKTEQSIYEIELPNETFEIIFFDAFAPAKQPDMWKLSVLEKTVNALKPRGVFVTYCAKGQLKRDLKTLRLTVETLPGPPGKREMVRAVK